GSRRGGASLGATPRETVFTFSRSRRYHHVPKVSICDCDTPNLTARSGLWEDENVFMTQQPERLRIGDVARLAGVSNATVSRVLSGSPRVRPEARGRGLAVATRFGYPPSHLARHLRKGRTDVVGVLVSDIENPHFASLVRAIEDAVYRRGRRVLLCNTSEDAAKEASYLEALAAERVLGVLGHRRVGFIAGLPGVQTADERLAGYLEVVGGAALEAVVRQGDFSLEGGRRATAELIVERPAVTALLVANNQMTLGALDVLREGRGRGPGGG